jgi:hypothetical protein
MGELVRSLLYESNGNGPQDGRAYQEARDAIPHRIAIKC